MPRLKANGPLLIIWHVQCDKPKVIQPEVGAVEVKSTVQVDGEKKSQDTNIIQCHFN